MEHKIRKAVIAGEGEAIRDLLLSSEQIELVKAIAKRTPKPFIRASDLANETSCTIQNASAKLKRLYLAGYLQRICEAQESGGHEYVYRSWFK